MEAVGQVAFYRQIAQMEQRYTDEVQDSYAGLRCPSLLLWGADDQWIPVEKGRELARLLPGCEADRDPQLRTPDAGGRARGDRRGSSEVFSLTQPGAPSGRQIQGA